MNIPNIINQSGNEYGSFSFLSKGGMGEIYKGQELSSGAEIVIKLIVIENTDVESLLQTELDVCNSLPNKNIVTSLHNGRLVINGTNYLFIIQKYYKNGNLRLKIAKNLPLDTCFQMFLDILNGMREVHKKVVHRDLKPENILVGDAGELLITDFGLAKYIDEKTRSRSFKGFGTIPYMSPECWIGDKNTTAMDIYSLGIIFFEILTGVRPFSANTEIEWRECHLFSSFPNFSNYRSGISTKLEQIISKMSNKRANQRYSNIDDIVIAINEARAINNCESADIARLAAIGNMALQAKKAQELKLAQETEKNTEWIKFLNFEISELFRQFKEKIDAINHQFEDEKISIYEKPCAKNSTLRELKISFSNLSFKIAFGNYDEIDNYNQTQKNKQLDFQKRQYHGFVIHSPEDSYLKANNILLFGLAETNFKIGNAEYGYNLLLRKIDGSQYGEWIFIQFSENISPPTTKFGLTIHGFQYNLDKMRTSSFHTMANRSFSDKDIASIIEKILIAS
ncbi:serine/threonine-protein kinase [uncultured Sphaerotilus sp.]|uniref:serine/threonine-protein kinase n=1 Tax=uncultured Sphaerotilus sp. TaxID=474984 RepID=UPI0030CA1F95